MSEELKEVLDGTIQVAVKSILSKSRKGQKLTASDLKALRELRASLEVPKENGGNWDAEYRKFKALLAQIEYETQRGELLPREEVFAAWRNRYSHIKRHLLLWSKRLPGRLAGLDERAMGDALEEEVHFLLSLLSRPGKFTPAVGIDQQEVEGSPGEGAVG
jgi:hypothetical protein